LGTFTLADTPSDTFFSQIIDITDENAPIRFCDTGHLFDSAPGIFQRIKIQKNAETNNDVEFGILKR
jgi:hypothetical protein